MVLVGGDKAAWRGLLLLPRVRQGGRRPGVQLGRQWECGGVGGCVWEKIRMVIRWLGFGGIR